MSVLDVSSDPASRNAIRLESVSVELNGVRALDDVSLVVPMGELFGLIGPNGAGKTTVMNVVSGIVQPDSGRLELLGEPADDWRLRARARAGVIRSFQQVRLLEELSIKDNLLLGRERFRSAGVLAQLVGTPRSRTERKRDLQAVVTVMEVLGLADLRNRVVRDLPFGVRRLVDVGRAFAAEPRILLLDEPAAGLDPPSRTALLEAIAQAQRLFATTVVLVEHDVDLVRRACERSVVLNGGRVLAAGLTEDNLRAAQVVQAYFGSEHA